MNEFLSDDANRDVPFWTFLICPAVLTMLISGRFQIRVFTAPFDSYDVNLLSD